MPPSYSSTHSLWVHCYVQGELAMLLETENPFSLWHFDVNLEYWNQLLKSIVKKCILKFFSSVSVSHTHVLSSTVNQRVLPIENKVLCKEMSTRHAH